jgi:hypothetical protein
MWITGDSLSAPPMPPRCERFTNRLAWIWRLTGERNIIYDGDIHIPVLTLHTTGDGLVVVENESAYKQVVWEDGNGEFLRRTFEARAALHLHAGGNHRRRANAVGSLGNGKMARSGRFDFEYGSTLNGTGFYGLEHGLQS